MGSKNTNINDFESSIRAVCEPIFDKPLKEISFGKLLNLFRTARKYNVYSASINSSTKNIV